MERLSSPDKKKVYYGLDLLKLFMAFVVVMIHVQPFPVDSLFYSVFKPLLSVAVPVFFLISAFLLFSKTYGPNNNGCTTGGGYLFVVQRFTTRILILYGIWLLIEIPWIIYNKPYFKEPFLNGVLDFIKDALFATTFPGSWFLSALVVSVWVVFLISRVVKEEIVFVLSLFVSLYIIYGGFSDGLRGPFEWYSQNIREEVWLSFPISLVWVSMGQLMAKYKEKMLSSGSHIVLGLFCLAIYVCYLMLPLYLWTYPFAIALMWLALVINLPARKNYKTMREASILIFLFHFTIAGKMCFFLSFIGSDAVAFRFLYYVLVLAVSLAFAFTVLWLESKRFHFLKYLH